MKKTLILTGITASGTPHIGNYIGAIKPAIALSQNPLHDCHYFVADYHSLVKLWDPVKRRQYIQEIAATWLALGLDIEKATLYKQSDVPETFEMYWILTSLAAKGLLNRAHAYKALVAENLAQAEQEFKPESGKNFGEISEKNPEKNPEKNIDPDSGITMGLFNYPILMAADILTPFAEKIPVGKDQIQHIEITRDIAARFNHIYGDFFTLPEALIDENVPILPGLDGRKMSKSYNNTIPLFAPEKELQKLINKIKTNSQPPEEPKDPEGCPLIQIYRSFATPENTKALTQRYAKGIGWGEVKKILFEEINTQLTPARIEYHKLMENPEKIEKALAYGAEKARKLAKEKLEQVKIKIGMN
jgi:tryptophanyl-tRNA synthetase